MREEKRTVMVEKTIYIAEDGKEFSDKWSCDDYEYELHQKEQESIAKRLEFDTHGIDWPSMAHPTGSYHEYKWFRIENDQDLEDFCKAYSAYDRALKDVELVKSYVYYPDYICLVDYPNGPEHPEWFTLSKLMHQLGLFLSNFPVNEDGEFL